MVKNKPSHAELKQKVKEQEKKALEGKRTEEYLAREKALSESIIDSLPGVFYFFDNKGKFLRWNKNLEEISEYSTVDISEMSPLDFFVEKDKAKVAEKIRETFDKGRALVEAVVESKSGNKICFHFTGRRVVIDNESYLVGMGIDITERKRAEDAIRESEQFLNAIFNSIQDGISVLDPELNVMRVNKAMLKWYAHMLPLEGRKCYEAYHGRSKACEICPTLRSLESGKLEMNVVPLTQEKGVTGALELFAFPMLDDSGKPSGVVEFVRDITARRKTEKALREAELIYRTVADFTYDWEYWVGPEGTIRYISPSVERITGYQAQEFIDNPALFREIVFPEDRELLDTHQHDSRQELKLREIQFRIIRRDGEICWIEHACVPVKDHKERPLGFRASNRDITARKNAEEALMEYAEKIKLFAYSVSHDLKNPAIAIRLLAQALYKRYKNILDAKGKNYCEHIMRASEELAVLVEQINLYISTKEVSLNIESINLNQVFDAVRDEFSDQIIVRQISWIQPKELPKINVDRLSILRVLRNFVDNALKYGGEELSEIELGYEESDEFHIISVKDNGIGFAQGDSEKIFSLFMRTLTAKGIEGSGLGLAIANEIAEKHKGKVWAKSGLGKGAIFFISISKCLKPTT